MVRVKNIPKLHVQNVRCAGCGCIMKSHYFKPKGGRRTIYVKCKQCEAVNHTRVEVVGDDQ